MSERYFGDFAEADYAGLVGYAQMVRAFSGERWEWSDPPKIPADMAADAEVLFAWYSYKDYSGSAFVLFERGGELYEVDGGHCSCYGLEGQWEPEVTSWAALALRDFEYRVEDEAVRGVLLALIAERTA